MCTLTAHQYGMPTRRYGQRRCVPTKVRQPTHLHVFMRHYESRAHMISSTGFVHAGPCACPHVFWGGGFHATVRGSVPGLGGLKETKMLLPHPRVKVSIVGSLRDRAVACSASDRQGSNFESCVWRTVSSQSSHHPQEVLLA